jgi:hypothetical protein
MYYYLVFAILTLSFSKAHEGICKIHLKKTEIEVLEPLTIELNFKETHEPKLHLEFDVQVELVVNAGEEAVQFKVSSFFSGIKYWSEQGRIKERIPVFYEFNKNRFIFEKAGIYKIKINIDGTVSNEIQVQVHLGTLNLAQMDPLLKEKISSREFLKLLYLQEGTNATGRQYAHELMAQYPQSALARYAKNCVAISNYNDFFNDTDSIDEGKSAFLQYATEFKSALKDNPVKGHYLTRLTKYLRGDALYYGDKLEKSEAILSKLLKRPDEVRLKAINRLSYVLADLQLQNQGSNSLNAETLHEMMVIDSQQYLDSEEDSEEDEDD